MSTNPASQCDRSSSAGPRRPRAERLEPRHLLTTVVSVSPPAESLAAPLDTDVRATFDGPIDETSVSLDSLVVQSAQRGRLLADQASAGLDMSSPETIVVEAAQPFFPGELIEATATMEIFDENGEPLERSHVWQFRAAAGEGTALFGVSQTLAEVAGGDFEPNSEDVALGDIDGDGDLDAVTSISDVAYGPGPTRRATLWLNDGDGTFRNKADAFPLRPPFMARNHGQASHVRLGDLDADGDLDVVQRTYGNTPVEVLLNDGTGVFSLQDARDLPTAIGNVGAIALGDVNGDGHLDVFVAMDAFTETLQVWMNSGQATFTAINHKIVGPGGIPTDVALGDIDGDGDLDAVVGIEYGTGRASTIIWMNQGQGQFEQVDGLPEAGTGEVTSVELGDLDGDGDLDVSVGRRFGFDEIWLNDGSGQFVDSGQRLGIPAEERHGQTEDVAMGDLDGDGDLDLFAANYGNYGQYPMAAPNIVWLNDGSAHFVEHRVLSEARSQAVALGDLDGDSDLDAFVANTSYFFYAGGVADEVWLNLNGDETTVDLEVSLAIDGVADTMGLPPLKMNGDLITTRFTVTNYGPDAGTVNVVHELPVQIHDVVWACSASGGASSCARAGVGNVVDAPTIGAGESVTYTATGRVDSPDSNPFIQVSAHATPTMGAIELGSLTNNSASVQFMVQRVLEVEPLPKPNSHSAGASEPIRVRFADSLDPGSVTANTIAVHAEQSGRVLGDGGGVVANGSTALVAQDRRLHAGERVQVTVTDRVRDANGVPATFPSVWEYRVAATDGHGTFADRQELMLDGLRFPVGPHLVQSRRRNLGRRRCGTGRLGYDRPRHRRCRRRR